MTDNKTVETFHVKLIEYSNACKVTDLHSTHADVAGMADDTIRDAWGKNSPMLKYTPTKSFSAEKKL